LLFGGQDALLQIYGTQGNVTKAKPQRVFTAKVADRAVKGTGRRIIRAEEFFYIKSLRS
jgi:hypothetical protein